MSLYLKIFYIAGLVAGTSLLILQNWVIGPATLLTFAPFYFYRVPLEERMMVEQFGEQYEGYM